MSLVSDGPTRARQSSATAGWRRGAMNATIRPEPPVRIAFQLFGHLRTFARCAPSLRQHLIDRYPDSDVFVHTWDRLDSETVSHHAPVCEPLPVSAPVIDDVHALYRPRRLQVERQDPREMGELSFTNGNRVAISGIAYMFASMQRADRLRHAYSVETGTSYDLVVAVRPDIELFRPLDLHHYVAYSQPPQLAHDETDRLRWAAFGPVPPVLNDFRGLPGTDILFFARPDTMTRILAIADDYGRYDMPMVVGASRPRNLLNTYCDDIGVTTAVIDYWRPRDFQLVRG